MESEFQKMVKEDLDTFFNLDEFGETHIIDSSEVTCIITDDEIQSNSDNYGSTFIETKKVSMKTTDFELVGPYKKGSEVFIDDERYLVINVYNKQGITELKLEGTRS